MFKPSGCWICKGKFATLIRLGHEKGFTMTPPDIGALLPQLVETIPYMRALGTRFDGRTDDGVTLRLPWRADLVGDPESRVIAGGVVTALLDHGMGLATWDRIGKFKPIATLDMRIDYMRPAIPERDLMVTARCYKLTRSVAFVRAFAYDDSPEDPVAAAQAAFVLTAQSGSASGEQV